jgi:tetratricopeptide (TPR) repeat protein
MPDEAAARFARALEHKINGEYDEAESLFKSVIAEQPENADAYHELGLTYSYRVYMDESIECLNKAVSLRPNSTQFLISLGKTHAMYGDVDQARPIFLKVQEMDPFNVEAAEQLQFLDF